MKFLIAMFIAALVAGCASFTPPPDTKSNYTGRDFNSGAPNAGFPSPPIESAGDGADAGGAGVSK